MKEKIGNVFLDYAYYKGTDEYSDGGIEDELLSMVEKEKDIDKLLKSDNRWPVLYHLSPVRQNILAWYPFKPDADVLEIGSERGAITGIISEKAGSVTCIELSKKDRLLMLTEIIPVTMLTLWWGILMMFVWIRNLTILP